MLLDDVSLEQSVCTRQREWIYYPYSFEPLAMLQEQSFFYHNDPNGCPTRLLDTDGKVVWAAWHDALGKVDSLLVNQVDNPLRMQGQYFDGETGLYYNRYRYFDLVICAFVSQDPLGFSCKKGRGGKQERLRELANDDKLSSALRGEIKRDINQIKRGKRTNIRVPQGYQLAHRRGKEARNGFGYNHSDLQVITNLRTQHKIDGHGKKRGRIMNQKEFDAVVKLPAEKRYEYFIKKVVDSEEVWGLFNNGWATTQDDNGNILIPFWPKMEFAKYCAKDEWEDYAPEKIDLDEYIDEWLTGMEGDGNNPSIFWNNIDSVMVEVDTLLKDLNTEFENY